MKRSIPPSEFEWKSMETVTTAWLKFPNRGNKYMPGPEDRKKSKKQDCGCHSHRAE